MFILFVICVAVYLPCSIASNFRWRWRVQSCVVAIVAALGAAVVEAIVGKWFIVACWSVFAALEAVCLLLILRQRKLAVISSD